MLNRALGRMVKRIVTHNGTFHCDESLACFLLKQTEEFKDAEIIRTRDPSVIETADIVVDVGAIYDPEKYVLSCIMLNYFVFMLFY